MNGHTIDFCEIIKSVIHPDTECGLNNNIDWSHMVRLAKEHNLFPIFLEGAVNYQSYIARSEYEREMKQALGIVAGQVKHTNAFLRLYVSFLEVGIHPIVMKGLVCRELYGRLNDHRPSGDEDILIHPSEYQKAQEVLVNNGYVQEIESATDAQLEYLQEISFFHPKYKLHIELHLNPMGRMSDSRSRMTDCFRNVFENYRDIEINGVLIRTMSHQEHLLFLILHAFKHFTGGGFGIRQILDILLYQEKYGKEIDIEELRNVLQEFRADVFWSDLIHIGNMYFGFDLTTWQETFSSQELLEDVICSGVFGDKTQAGEIAARTTMRANANYLKNEKSNSLIMLWKSIFPSKDYMLPYSPYLKAKPWLLPIAWIRRWGRFIKGNKQHKGNLIVDTMKISQRRMKLLKKYDLV